MATDSGAQRFQSGDGTEDSTQRGCTSWLLISCVIITLTTAFVFGWGLGAPNMYNKFTEPFLRGEFQCHNHPVAAKDINSASDANTADLPSLQQKSGENDAGEDMADKSSSNNEGKFNFLAELIKGIPQTIFLIGAFIGAITAPIWTLLFDRKRTVFVNYIFTFSSSLLVLLGYYFKMTFLIYASRFVLGYQGGTACVCVPPFIGELSSQRVRGIAGAAFQLSLTIGILVAQVIGLPFIAGSCTNWGWGLSIVFLLPLAGIFVLFLLPNSPTQMIAKYGDEDQARADLKKLRGTNNVDADLQAIREETRQASGSKTESLSIFELFKSPRYRWPMLTTVILQGSQAFSGINAVFFYSSKMFEKAGIPADMIPYANIGTGAINVLATIVSLFLIERIGRRALIVYPMAVMVLVFGILTALVQLNETRNNPILGVISVIFILIFIVCFAVGLGPIPFLYGTEVCRPEARDGVQSLGLGVNYLGNILLSLFFPALNSILGGYVFLIFLVLVSLNLAFLWFKMPETKNKTIEDAERFWKIAPLEGKGALLTNPNKTVDA